MNLGALKIGQCEKFSLISSARYRNLQALSHEKHSLDPKSALIKFTGFMAIFSIFFVVIKVDEKVRNRIGNLEGNASVSMYRER